MLHTEYDTMFNGNKSKLLYFRLIKGRSSVMLPSEIMVNGQIVGVYEKKTDNLGHTVLTTDFDGFTKAIKNIFWKTPLLQILNS